MAALPIILNILKITGIVLACILGFVILLLLMVLFIPVRYRLSFVRTGVEGDDPVNARGYVSWLLHIVHVSLAYPAENIVIIRVFGIPVKRISLGDKKSDDPNDEEQGTETGAVINDVDTASDAETAEISSPAEEEFLSHDAQSDDIGEDLQDSEITDEKSDNDDVSDRSIFSRIKVFVHKIRCTLRDFCDKIKKIADDTYNKAEEARDKLESIRRDIHYYHNILTSELFERTFEKCRKRIIKLLKSILPRKGDIRLEVGFDDPYTTGEVLAIAGILYPLIGKYVHICGNFDESVIRGGGYLKGRIYVITIAKLGLFYLTDRDLKRTIKLLKKEPVKKAKHKF